MSTRNTFIGNTTTTINTPVISQSVMRCDTSKRRRRRSATAVGVTDGSTTLVNINIPEDSLGLLVNATPTSQYDGIAMSEFNVTTAGSVPLVIRVTPVRPNRVIVYVRRDALPTTSEYDWLLSSWDNNDNYTLYIAADLTNDVSRIYVGVQSIAGTLFLQSASLVLP